MARALQGFPGEIEAIETRVIAAFQTKVTTAQRPRALWSKPPNGRNGQQPRAPLHQHGQTACGRESWAKRERLGEVLVDVQIAGDGAGDLGRPRLLCVRRVRRKVAFVIDEYLGFILQTAKRRCCGMMRVAIAHARGCGWGFRARDAGVHGCRQGRPRRGATPEACGGGRGRLGHCDGLQRALPRDNHGRRHAACLQSEGREGGEAYVTAMNAIAPAVFSLSDRAVERIAEIIGQENTALRGSGAGRRV